MPSGALLNPETRCEDCLAALRGRFPGKATISRAFVAEVHAEHEPPHPARVGGAGRPRARREHAEWAALDPYARASEDGVS